MLNRFLIAVSLVAFVQAVQSTPLKPITDTTFLEREDAEKPGYHAVFIETNRASRYYRNLFDFRIKEKIERDGYDYNLSRIKKRKLAVRRFNLRALAREWMPVERYKNKYYTYYPSEWGNIDRCFITDSTLVYWNMEPPEPHLIKHFSQVDFRTYKIQLNERQFSGTNKRSALIIIHIIDPQTQLAVWEYPFEDPTYRYELRMPKKYAARLEMIVNYCKTHKTPEFMGFDKIDYKQLIRSAK